MLTRLTSPFIKFFKIKSCKTRHLSSTIFSELNISRFGSLQIKEGFMLNSLIRNPSTFLFSPQKQAYG
ncbi:hypothetical protein CICLE_v10024631mg [Citrus x clementina]|uniref:Uncharacterized protein n=1 Tax=Citrus clementina TaxID=85681 RepID=V4TNS1_CITCL|nr:hypothetical protein CICLE_v10024631mg [Citrus x clementina]